MKALILLLLTSAGTVDLGAANDSWTAYFWKIQPCEVKTTVTVKHKLKDKDWVDTPVHNEKLFGYKNGLIYSSIDNYFNEKQHTSFGMGTNEEYFFMVDNDVKKGLKTEYTELIDKNSWRLRQMQIAKIVKYNGIMYNDTMPWLRIGNYDYSTLFRNTYFKVRNYKDKVLEWDYAPPLGGGKEKILRPLVCGTIIFDQNWMVKEALTTFASPEYPIVIGGKAGANVYDETHIVNTFGERNNTPVITSSHELGHYFSRVTGEKWVQTDTKYEWNDFDEGKIGRTRLGYYGIREPILPKHWPMWIWPTIWITILIVGWYFITRQRKTTKIVTLTTRYAPRKK